MATRSFKSDPQGHVTEGTYVTWCISYTVLSHSASPFLHRWTGTYRSPCTKQL